MSQRSQDSSYSNTNININNESAGSNTIQTGNLSRLLRNNSRLRPILRRIVNQQRIRASQLVAVLRSLPWMNPNSLFTNNRPGSRTIYASIRRSNIQSVITTWSRPGNNRLINITPSLRQAARIYLTSFNGNISQDRELIRSAVHAMERTERSFNSPPRPFSRRRRDPESNSNSNSNNSTHQSSQKSSRTKMTLNQWKRSIR
tara:strand:+ start:95 stop:700 length:606 start_codon:yes stop_codon:yes gene_type:complete